MEVNVEVVVVADVSRCYHRQCPFTSPTVATRVSPSARSVLEERCRSESKRNVAARKGVELPSRVAASKAGPLRKGVVL